MVNFAYLEEYEVIVFEDGQVFRKNGTRYATSISRHGYEMLSLHWGKGKRKTTSVHRIVAKTFLNNPYNKSDVNHKDGNKLNNHVSNLEWVTRQENMMHAIESGLLIPKGKPKTCSERDAQIKEDHGKGLNTKQLMEKYKLTACRIRQIIRGYNSLDNYKHKTNRYQKAS